MPGVLCDNRRTSHVKGTIHTMIVQPNMQYELDTVPMSSSHLKKLELTEVQICRWACGHILRDRVRNDNIIERLNVDNNNEICRNARLM